MPGNKDRRKRKENTAHRPTNIIAMGSSGTPMLGFAMLGLLCSTNEAAAGPLRRANFLAPHRRGNDAAARNGLGLVAARSRHLLRGRGARRLAVHTQRHRHEGEGAEEGLREEHDAEVAILRERRRPRVPQRREGEARLKKETRHQKGQRDAAPRRRRRPPTNGMPQPQMHRCRRHLSCFETGEPRRVEQVREQAGR